MPAVVQNSAGLTLALIGTTRVVCWAGPMYWSGVCSFVPLFARCTPLLRLLLWARRAGDINGLLRGQCSAANVISVVLTADVGSWTQDLLMCKQFYLHDVLIVFTRFVRSDCECFIGMASMGSRVAQINPLFPDWRLSIRYKLALALCLFCLLVYVPSVLWRCWLGGRKGIRPVKNWAVGCWHGYLPGARCRLAYGPADATATHCLLLQ